MSSIIVLMCICVHLSSTLSFFEAPSWVLSSLWHLPMSLQWRVGLVSCTAHSYSTLGKPTLMQNPNNYLWFRQFMCFEAYKHFILIYSHYICILIIDTNPVVYICYIFYKGAKGISEKWCAHCQKQWAKCGWQRGSGRQWGRMLDIAESGEQTCGTDPVSWPLLSQGLGWSKNPFILTYKHYICILFIKANPMIYMLYIS